MDDTMLLRSTFLLILLPLAASSETSNSSAAVATCPYDFATAAGMIPPDCHANATVPTATSCCWYVFAAYLYAAVRYSNLTGAAFLPAPTTSACASSYFSLLLDRRLVHRDLLHSTTCNLAGDPLRLAAGNRPCQFPTLASLRSSVDLSVPILSCTAPSLDLDDSSACVPCQTAVIAATFSLFDATGSKEFVPCGMATSLGVWSANPPSIPRFRSYALCMLQVLENVGDLSTGNLIPSPPSLTPPPPRSSRSRSIQVAAGSAAAALAAAAAIVVLTLAIMRRRRAREVEEEEERDMYPPSTSTPTGSSPLPTEGLYIFTKSELKQATGGYSDRLLLGEGGSGKVYLGRLPSGQHVAIKRIFRKKKLGEFYREVEILSKLRHRSLATLVGYGVGRRDHALVYEYMGGGTLSRALHRGELTWRGRVRVAADVAEGLAYIHELPDGAVVHRDVKPTNVLLTEGGRAKLSDFGVSRVMPEGGTHVSTEVRGTMGYVDPESISAGHVSELADVYSFGVVLLELVTGMRAVVPTPSGGAESIVHVARGAVAEGEDWTSIVDPRLGPEWDRATVREVFDLAGKCVRPFKNERPRMAEVLAVLKRVLADLEARTGEATDDVALSGQSADETTTTDEFWSLSSSNARASTPSVE